MTVNSNALSTHDTSGRKDQTTLGPTDGTLSKDSTVLHETRSQKLARVNGQQDDHAETKEPSPNQPEFSSPNVRVSTRSSTRPQKRQRKSLSSPQATVQQDAPTTGSSRATKKTGKKRKRQWESWSLEDKNAFFDALHEHGKDFDKIQIILQTRHKRRGDPKNLIKNKDQVRHFYYRTLNKISKYVPKDKQFTTETDPHQKTVLELRSLTCFGELRKRIGGLGEKQGKKLHELLEYGWTTIRQSGRNARLKAPTCRALKRLTLGDTLGKCDESSNLPPPVPSKLDLEFLPIDNATWLAVQGLSKNPRLKTTVSSKKPLSLVITFLTKKWPVKSSKPGTNEFLALCIAVPVEFVLAEDSQQSESTLTETIPDLNKNNIDSNQHKDSPMENDTQNLADREVQCTNPSLQIPNVNNPSNSPHTISKDGHNVAGSTDSSTNERKLWTSANCGNITIGDIYCKLQRPPKLKFEYLFQQGDTSPVTHGNNALQKLVGIAKTEFLSTKKGSTASRASNADSGKPANRMNPGRTLRIAPKASERFPFILPSIFQPAPRQMFNQTTLVNPSSSMKTAITYSNNRKRLKKNQQPVTKSPNVVQRTLLPNPGNAMPRGAVAVSFIPQPVQALSPAPSPVFCTDSTAHALSPDVSPKPVASSTSSLTTTKTILADTPPPTSPLTPVTTPSPSSNVITTILETGIRQHPVANNPAAPQENISSGLNDISCISNPVITLPEVDQLIDTLQNFTPRAVSTGLDSDMSAVNTSLQLDPAVTMKDDSSSELLASIIGLNAFPTTNTPTLSTVSDSQSIKSSTEGHIQELTTGIAGCSAVSFPTTSFVDILSASSTGTVPSVATCSATTPHSLFFNSVSENSSDAFNVNTNDKPCLSLNNVPTTLFASLQASPVGLTSPTPDHQWFNGEVSDISLSLFDKFAVSPEKEPKFGFDVPSVPLFTVSKDSASQDSLFGGKSVIETAQAERALRAIMDENSVDFVKKFQDLTKQITSEDKCSNSGGESSSDSCKSGALSFKNLICKPENTSD